MVGFVIRRTAIDNPPIGLVGWAIVLHPDRAARYCTDVATTVGCYCKTVGALKITQKTLKSERTQTITMLFRASKISRIGPIVANVYRY